MDVYEFFNSKDIATHCKNIGHKFTAMEMAYLVWRSNHHTLVEKHEAWQEIIDTMPDEPFFEDCYIPLHSFLRVYIKMQNKFIRNFRSASKNRVFSFVLTGSNKTNEVFWDSYDTCLDVAKTWLAECSDDNGITGVTITKHLKRDNTIRWWYDEAICLNRDLSVMDIVPAKKDYDPDDERFYLDGEPIFQEMQITIPSPFRKGDIVVNVNNIACSDQCPLVLDEPTVSASEHMESGGGAEYMYRLMDGWFEDEIGSAYKNIGFDFLDLEHAQIQPDFYKSFLYAMSRYLKGEITLSRLLDDHAWALLDGAKSSATGENEEEDILL